MKTETQIINGIIVNTNTYEESDFATASQKQAWLAVCDSCESKNNDRCGSCGCLFESLMNLATSKCPIDKW
jgi:hypothetical protein